MTTFPQYANNAAYLSARDALTAQWENPGLVANTSGSGLFYYDPAGLNIGFGYNITGQTGDLTALKATLQTALSVGTYAVPEALKQIQNIQERLTKFQINNSNS
jgi:hypothetical protein